MKAAELLRGLDKNADAAPWGIDVATDGYVYSLDKIACDRPRLGYDGHNAWIDNSKCIATTRNLLPLLAGLVEAVEFANRESCADPRVPLLPFGITSALAALNAAAAKEVS